MRCALVPPVVAPAVKGERGKGKGKELLPMTADAGLGGNQSNAQPNLCPMPHAPCPMPHAQCPMPHAPCPMPYLSTGIFGTSSFNF
ncbi:hypothetical protein [Tolypothrix sp. VBCCA 56010]|uniref:hypothetical protein n=1 Tax=Tolypothrix sp. VBCCA 56010 TaxID=3137731 RepID=UPI003D7D062B